MIFRNDILRRSAPSSGILSFPLHYGLRLDCADFSYGYDLSALTFSFISCQGNKRQVSKWIGTTIRDDWKGL
jgi:hypothetical protein